jgi:hypothetical protein
MAQEPPSIKRPFNLSPSKRAVKPSGIHPVISESKRNIKKSKAIEGQSENIGPNCEEKALV